MSAKIKKFNKEKIVLDWEVGNIKKKLRVSVEVHRSGFLCYHKSQFDVDGENELRKRMNKHRKKNKKPMIKKEDHVYTVTHVNTGKRIFECRSEHEARYIISQIIKAGNQYWDFDKVGASFMNSRKSEKVKEFLYKMESAQKSEIESSFWPKW